MKITHLRAGKLEDVYINPQHVVSVDPTDVSGVYLVTLVNGRVIKDARLTDVDLLNVFMPERRVVTSA